MTNELCDKVVSKDPFMLKCCLDRYKTQEMCDKAVDAFLSPLKFVPDWFFTSKMIKKFDDDLFSNDDIIFVNEDPNNVALFTDEIGFVGVDLNKMNLDDVNFDENDPETITPARCMAWCY